MDAGFSFIRYALCVIKYLGCGRGSLRMELYFNVKIGSGFLLQLDIFPRRLLFFD